MGQFLAHPGLEELPTPGVDATDHDPFGIQHVDKHRETPAEPAATLRKHSPGARVAMGSRPGYGLRRDALQPFAVGAVLGRLTGREPALSFLPCEPGDTAARAETLERSPFPVSLGTVLGQADVPDLTREVRWSLVEPAVENKPCPHARAEGQEHHASAAPAGAEPPFCDRAGIRVVLEPGRRAERPRHEIHDRHMAPLGKVRRRQNESSPAVEWSAAADADAREGPGRDGTRGEQGACGGTNAVDDRAGSPSVLRWEGLPVQDFRFPVRESAQYDRRLGAADVDTDECLHPPSQTGEECSTEQRQRTASEERHSMPHWRSRVIHVRDAGRATTGLPARLRQAQGSAAGDTSTSLMRSQPPKRWRSHIDTPSDTTKPM